MLFMGQSGVHGMPEGKTNFKQHILNTVNATTIYLRQSKKLCMADLKNIELIQLIFSACPACDEFSLERGAFDFHCILIPRA